MQGGYMVCRRGQGVAGGGGSVVTSAEPEAAQHKYIPPGPEAAQHKCIPPGPEAAQHKYIPPGPEAAQEGLQVHGNSSLAKPGAASGGLGEGVSGSAPDADLDETLLELSVSLEEMRGGGSSTTNDNTGNRSTGAGEAGREDGGAAEEEAELDESLQWLDNHVEEVSLGTVLYGQSLSLATNFLNVTCQDASRIHSSVDRNELTEGLIIRANTASQRLAPLQLMLSHFIALA